MSLVHVGSCTAAPENAQTRETLVEMAADARLRQSANLELRRITCTFIGGVLLLQGWVSSYYLSQVAQTFVQELDGVEAIDNQLTVISPGSFRF